MKKIIVTKNKTNNTPEIVEGMIIPLGCTTEEKINTLQSIKDSMANCMMANMNDDLTFDSQTTNNLQLFYMQADAQIKKLQQQNYNRVAIA